MYTIPKTNGKRIPIHKKVRCVKPGRIFPLCDLCFSSRTGSPLPLLSLSISFGFSLSLAAVSRRHLAYARLYLALHSPFLPDCSLGTTRNDRETREPAGIAPPSVPRNLASLNAAFFSLVRHVSQKPPFSSPFSLHAVSCIRIAWRQHLHGKASLAQLLSPSSTVTKGSPALPRYLRPPENTILATRTFEKSVRGADLTAAEVISFPPFQRLPSTACRRSRVAFCTTACRAFPRKDDTRSDFRGLNGRAFLLGDRLPHQHTSSEKPIREPTGKGQSVYLASDLS